MFLLWEQVLCIAGSLANPFPGVATNCLLVDGRQQRERMEQKVSDTRNAGPGDATFREKLFGICSPGLGGVTGRVGS